MFLIAGGYDERGGGGTGLDTTRGSNWLTCYANGLLAGRVSREIAVYTIPGYNSGQLNHYVVYLVGKKHM